MSDFSRRLQNRARNPTKLALTEPESKNQNRIWKSSTRKNLSVIVSCGSHLQALLNHAFTEINPQFA